MPLAGHVCAATSTVEFKDDRLFGVALSKVLQREVLDACFADAPRAVQSNDEASFHAKR